MESQVPEVPKDLLILLAPTLWSILLISIATLDPDQP
jgi:hypothetical protein